MTEFRKVSNIEEVLTVPVKKTKLKGLLVSSIFLIAAIVSIILQDTANAILAGIVSISVMIVYYVSTYKKKRNSSQLLLVEPFLKLDEEKIQHGKTIIFWNTITHIAIVGEDSSNIENLWKKNRSEIVFRFQSVLDTPLQKSPNLFEGYGAYILKVDLKTIDEVPNFLQQVQEISRSFGNISYMVSSDIYEVEKFLRKIQ